MSETQYFAYGYWTVKDNVCPIEAAGLTDHQWATEVAEDFDDEVAQLFDPEAGEGLVNREKAKEAWEHVIKSNKRQYQDPMDEWTEEMHKERLKLANKVKRELFEDD